MRVFDLDYRTVISANKDLYEKYRQAGLWLTDFREEDKNNRLSHTGFHKILIELDDNTLVENLSKLSMPELLHLPSFVKTELEPILERAKNLNIFNSAYKKNDSGYALSFCSNLPFTWELNDKAKNEILLLAEKFKPYGITEIRIGQEIEFTTSEHPVNNSNHWETVKNSIIKALEQQISSAGNKKDELTLKLEEVKQFNAREVMMYDMIELDERTKGVLEPLFGRTHDGNGYYDGQNCLELKIDHCEISQYSKNQETVLNVLADKIKQYGIVIESQEDFGVTKFSSPKSHLSFSFWDEKGNLFDPSHPEYKTKGKILLEGITKGVFEGLPLVMGGDEMTHTGADTILRPSNRREGLLRTANGRIELRPAIREQHAETMMMPVLSGALSALEHQHDLSYKNEFKQAVVVKAVSLSSPKDEQWKIFAKSIASSEINKDGSLNIPGEYISQGMHKIAYELGLRKKKPLENAMSVWDESPYAKGIMSFIKNIRIETDGKDQRIIWPENHEKGYSFIDLQNNEQIIDTKKLDEKLKIKKISDRLVMGEGYSLSKTQTFNDSRDRAPKLFTKIETAKNSRILKDHLSPGFYSDIANILEKQFPKPVIVQPLRIEDVLPERKEEIKALLVAAMELNPEVELGARKTINFPITNPKHNQDAVTEILSVFADLNLGKSVEKLRNDIGYHNNYQEIEVNFYRDALNALKQIKADPKLVEKYKPLVENSLLKQMKEIAAAQVLDGIGEGGTQNITGKQNPKQK